MSSIVISGDTSGAITLASPSVAGTNTATLPAATGTVMVSGNMPAFSAYSSTSQSIANATNTKVVYDVKDYDTASCFSSNRFTPTVSGYYNIYAYFQFTATLNINQIQIYKNGSQYKTFTTSNSAAGCSSQISQQMYLNGTTDYVEIYIYQNSGSSANINGGQNSSAFQGILVRAA